MANLYIYIDSSKNFKELSTFSINLINTYNKVAPNFVQINIKAYEDIRKTDFDDLIFEGVFFDREGTLNQIR